MLVLEWGLTLIQAAEALCSLVDIIWWLRQQFRRDYVMETCVSSDGACLVCCPNWKLCLKARLAWHLINGLEAGSVDLHLAFPLDCCDWKMLAH